ncbi:hypothetical protein EDD18DRAFT_1056547, partial [Armillaria luteobubalina]
TEVARIELTLKQLRIGIDRVQSYALAYGALLAPVRRLPYDILLKIFEDICTVEGFRTIRPPATCLRLGLVCTRWRRVTLVSPSLWSILCVPAALRPRTSAEWDSIAKLLHVQYVRSGNMPLTL